MVTTRMLAAAAVAAVVLMRLVLDLLPLILRLLALTGMTLTDGRGVAEGVFRRGAILVKSSFFLISPPCFLMLPPILSRLGAWALAGALDN